VHVEADVDEQGIPTAVRVRRSSGCGILDGAAAGAVREWRFSPARIAGKAARQRVVVPIEFRLKEFRTSFLINKRELSPSGRRGQPANPG
jgi:TonB family protein